MVHMRRAKVLASGIGKVELEVPPLVRNARSDFGAFCEVLGKPNAHHHRQWVDEFVTGVDSAQLLRCGGPNTAVLAPRGPLDCETPVATPHGWRPLHSIRVGDLVFAGSGEVTEVLATVDYPDTECWEVVMSDGTSVVCDDSHRWDVRRMGTDARGEWRTVTLQEIRQFVTVGMSGNHRTGVTRLVRLAEDSEKPWLDGRGYARYQVPIAGPVDYPEIDLPLDPYLLGVLIGDGALTTGTARFHKDDPDLVERVRASLPEDCVLVPASKRAGDWRIRTVDGKSVKRGWGEVGNPVIDALKTLQLWGKRSAEKFIPRSYLQGSIAQRLALLQGLLDTDGTCKAQTGFGGVSFGSSSEQLMADVAELVRSLGGLVTARKPYQAGYRKADGTRVECQLSYRCGIRLPEGMHPFHSSRKAVRYRGPSSGRSNGGLMRSIVDIRPAGRRQVRCITVADSSEQFLVNDYLVVKNSAKSTVLGMLVAWLIGVHAQEQRMLRMLYLGYSLDIARSRSHTIKAIIGSRVYQEVFPMVRLSKARQSDELWAIDMEFAGIDVAGDDPYTLVGQGLSGSITSRRSQLIVLDDVVKSSESIQNPEIRRKLITNWQEVVQPTLLEGGRCIALGTRFSTVDIFNSTFNEKNGWRVITQQAIVTDDDGLERSYWPEFYTLEHLKKLRLEDPLAFSFQFQNQPVSRSEIDFPADWLKPADLSSEYDSLCVGIDLSSGLKERNDWTVMTLAGINGDQVEIIDFRRLRSMGNLEKIDALCELLADWGLLVEGEEKPDGSIDWFPTDVPVTINIEAISYQQSLQADAKEILLDKRGLHNLVLRAVTGYRGDKLSRFRGILGLFQTGRIKWNRWINWDAYWQELLNYGATDHDDCPDSLLLAVKGLVGPGRLQPAWGEWRED